MDEPKITVCIPTYNRASLLEGAISSVLSQDLRELEVVISDDGSGDNTPELVEKLHQLDPRIRNVGGTHLGFTDNLRRGLLACKGAGIVILADDDFLLPGALRSYSKVFENYPSVGVVASNMYQVDASGRKCTYVMNYFKKPSFFKTGQEALERIWPLATFISGLGIRRSSYLSSCKGYRNYPQLLMVGRMLLRYEGVGLPDYFVAARVHPEQFGGKMLTAYERETGKHAFLEMEMVLNQLTKESEFQNPLNERRILDPYLVRAYRAFVVNTKIENGTVAARGIIRTALATYSLLNANPLFVGTSCVSSILPSRVLSLLKDAYRIAHLNLFEKSAYSAFSERIEPLLIEYAHRC